jgi:hypothetical protein
MSLFRTPKEETGEPLLISPAEYGHSAHPEQKHILRADRERHHLHVLPNKQQVCSALADNSKLYTNWLKRKCPVRLPSRQSTFMSSLYTLSPRKRLDLVSVDGYSYEWPSSSPYGYYPANDTRVQRHLQLVHVRLLPTNLLHPDEQSNPYLSGGAGYPSRYPQAPPTSRPYVLSELENSAHAAGLTIAAHPGDTDGTDFLLCTSPDLMRIGALGQTHRLHS